MIADDSDTLTWLMEWYRSQCDGDWEHQYGVQIGTLDNPGWSLEIDLNGTESSEQILAPMQLERTEDDWVFVEAKESVFYSRGGPINLQEMIECFRAFLESRPVFSSGKTEAMIRRF